MKINDPRNHIAFEYSALRDGESSSGQICPSCEGGSSKEASLSVSRRGGALLFTCHRASCSFGGKISDPNGGGEEDEPTVKRAPRSMLRTIPMVKADIKLLASKYGVSVEDFELAGIGWTGEGDGTYGRRVSYPIFGPNSGKRGESYRSYEGKQPKSLIRLASPDSIAQAWYKWKRSSDAVIIVEDQVSAIKLAPYYHSVALLGTNLSSEKVREIKEGNYKAVYLVLDGDAIVQAIDLQQAYREVLPNLRVLHISKDIKNMNEKELREFLGRVHTFFPKEKLR